MNPDGRLEMDTGTRQLREVLNNVHNAQLSRVPDRAERRRQKKAADKLWARIERLGGGLSAEVPNV